MGRREAQARLTGPQISARLREKDVLIGYSSDRGFRAVTHCWIDDSDIEMFGPGSDAIAHLIPLRGIQSPPEIYNQLTFMGKLWDNIHHLIGPIACLTIGSFAGLTILTKNSVIPILRVQFVVGT